MSGTLLDRLADCRRVHLDTNVLIYWIENKSPYQALIGPLFRRIEEGRLDAVSSVLTLAELLVVPLKEERLDLVKRYKELLLESNGFRLIDVNRPVAEQCARLRAKYASIKTPDCLQLATAVHTGADAFVTNDVRLRQFDEIPVIVLEDLLDASR